ncbi:unnamed protein product [Cladocopium goreaui]|uniref:Uncharacterized protein n=1 Tax=Cladocopium goreaui TaxID=2562237 RepID=A0A9P1BG28_9DINO|nr:unnamed protein product [Cladocopium goreaui]
MKLRLAVSFNGPDGDYYTSGIISSTAFRLPYAIKRDYGWAEGGATVQLLGIVWPEDADLELQLIFVFPQRNVSTECSRVTSHAAECIVPTPPKASTVNLQMKTMRNGEVATYDLPLTYSFMEVPTLLGSFPQRASVKGGTMSLRRSGGILLRLPGTADGSGTTSAVAKPRASEIPQRHDLALRIAEGVASNGLYFGVEFRSQLDESGHWSCDLRILRDPRGGIRL